MCVNLSNMISFNICFGCSKEPSQRTVICTRKRPRPLCLHHIILWSTHQSKIPIYALPVLVRLKLHDPWVCTILEDPLFAHQIKIAQPLGLHYIIRPLGLHYNNYVSLARPLSLHYNLAWPLWYTHWSNLPLYPIPVLVRLKLHDSWVCTILHNPGFARQIKIAWPLGLHYITRPSGPHCNHYMSLAWPLGLHCILHDPWVCTIITMWVGRGQLAKMLITGRTWYILIKFWIQMHINSIGMCNSLFWWTRICWASFQLAHNSWTAWYYLDHILHTYLF